MASYRSWLNSIAAAVANNDTITLEERLDWADPAARAIAMGSRLNRFQLEQQAAERFNSLNDPNPDKWATLASCQLGAMQASNASNHMVRSVPPQLMLSIWLAHTLAVSSFIRYYRISHCSKFYGIVIRHHVFQGRKFNINSDVVGPSPLEWISTFRVSKTVNALYFSFPEITC
jgi:hypothetical protein